ncbi:MAG: class I SAM-dependent methyltransferase [Chloroflexota bacterium]
MNQDIAPYLLCAECGADRLLLEVYSFAENEQVIEGCLRCVQCSSWFRIENGILDLLPMRLRQRNYHRFMLRNERFAVKHNLPLLAFEDTVWQSELLGKTKPVGAFEDVVDYEKRVVNNPYYKALDRVAFFDWMERNLTNQDFVLDIGCGTGRQCIPLAERSIRVVGIDIDEEMLQEAVKKVDNSSIGSWMDLIVGDGENPPVKPASFTACIFYGVLHHLSDKQKAIANAADKLLPGAYVYSLDPHKSSARFAFDLLMRLWQLYVEEADEDPLISENQLREWMQNARIEGKVKLSTYLPPHIFVTGFTANVSLLKITDRIFSHIPGIRNIGGVIIFEGRHN